MIAVTLATTKPDAVRTPDPDIVSPGFAGFLTVFALAVVTVLLIRSMTKHMRKVKFLAEADEQAQAEARARTGAEELNGPHPRS